MTKSVRKALPVSPAMLALLVLAGIASGGGCGHPSAASPPTSSQSTPPQKTPASEIPAEKTDFAQNEGPKEVPAHPAISQPAATKSKPPPADRGPQKPGDAAKITFDDLNLGLQADVVYRPFMLTDRAKELDGQRVSIMGYMHPGVESQRGVKEFVLLRNLECKFGPGGQADHLAQIKLRGGSTTNYSLSPIKVEGTLKIDPFEGADGNTWAIYRLEEAGLQ